MKKLIKYPGFTRFGILALIMSQSSTAAANGKAPHGSLGGLQISGGFLVLLLIIVIARIKGRKSTDISIPS